MATVIKRKLLGIEIGTDAVSAVLIETQRGEDRIQVWNRLPVDPKVAPDERLASVLAPVLGHGERAAMSCTVSLAADGFVLRHLRAPFAEERKLRQVLPFELEPTLAQPAEAFVFDYLTCDDQRRPEILAAAIEQARLAEVLAGLAALRIDPELVTVAGLGAALRIGRAPQADDHLVAADLRPDGATVFLIAKGRLLTMRDMPLDAASAEGRRLFIERLAHTFRAVSPAAGEAKAFAPQRIVLIGYGPQTAELEPALAERFQVPVERADLRGHLTGGMSADASPGWEPGQLNGVLGLALAGRGPQRGFNLRQGPFAVKKFWTRHGRSLRRSAALALLVLVLAAVHVAVSMVTMTRQNEQLNTEIVAVFRETFPETTRIVDPLQQMRSRIEALRDSIQLPGTESARPRAIDILDALSRGIGANLDVELTRLVVGPDNLVVTGHTDTFNAVDEIKTGLSSGGMFKDVTISAANIDKQSGRVRFTLNIGRLEAAHGA